MSFRRRKLEGIIRAKMQLDAECTFDRYEPPRPKKFEVREGKNRLIYEPKIEEILPRLAIKQQEGDDHEQKEEL